MDKLISFETLQYYDGKIKEKINKKTEITDLSNSSTTTTYSVNKINSLINSKIAGGIKFKDVLATKADLLAIINASGGDLYIVEHDESITGSPRRGYIYSDSGQWEELSDTSQRIFTDNPLNLVTETTGTLPQSKMDLTGLAKTTDLNAYTTTNDLQVNYVTKTQAQLKTNISDIVDDLTHTDVDKPLSANQGKVLKGFIDSKTSGNAPLWVITNTYKKFDLVTSPADGQVYKANSDIVANTAFKVGTISNTWTLVGGSSTSNHTIKNGNFTAEIGKSYAVDSSTSSIIISLPTTTSLNAGDTIKVFDVKGYADVNNIIFDFVTANQTLINEARNFIINSKYCYVVFIWDGMTWRYSVLSIASGNGVNKSTSQISVTSIMTVRSAKPTVQGYYIFSIIPTDGLPSVTTGISLNDIAYYDGLSWSLFCKYVDASATITVGTSANNQVVFRKQNGGWISENGVYGYIRVRCTSNKTVSNKSAIKFDTTTLIQGDTIKYDSTTGVFALSANSNYEFIGSGGNASVDWIAYQWEISFDGTNWNRYDAGGCTVATPNPWTGVASNNIANGAISATQTVYLRLCSYMTQSSETIGAVLNSVANFDEYGWASVKEIAKSQSVIIRPQFDVIPQEYIAYTPTIGVLSGTAPILGSSNSIKAMYKVVGKTMILHFNYYQSVGGSDGTGLYYISLPNDKYKIDTNLANLPSSLVSTSNSYIGANCITLGIGRFNASNSQDVKVVALADNKIGLYMCDSYGLWGNGLSWMASANLTISFVAQIPLMSY
jgi:hypothetical protein